MKHLKKILTVILMIAYLPLLAILLLLWSSGYLGFLLKGSHVVQSAESPGGKHMAYVLDAPSIDPPNQSLYVERADQTRFMFIAQLAGDVDSIKEILWSPDGGVVVFHSHFYLTATRVSDWRTIRVYLGAEWRRTKPQLQSTFTSGGVKRFVESIEFAGENAVVYRLKDDNKQYALKFVPAT
jgi:hypothetical protein